MEYMVTLAIWGGFVLLAMVMVIFALVAHYLRKRFDGVGDGTIEGSSLELHALCELHKRGDLRDEEYRILRDEALGTTSDSPRCGLGGGSSEPAVRSR